jgi:hypothetical protein
MRMLDVEQPTIRDFFAAAALSPISVQPLA